MATDTKRLLSLDILRGMTVAGMILVNNGYGESFEPLTHSAWNGMTPCDLVFPFFLFMMGISTYLSLRKFDFRLSPAVVKKIIRRTVVIFAIGLLINWMGRAVGGDFSLSHLRIMAVLQRIALCYCAVSFIALTLSHRHIIPLAAVLLAGYGAVLLLCQGYAPDDSNIAMRIDDAILGHNHLYTHTPIDPEGLLGTIPSIAHTLIGFYCGLLLMKGKDTIEKVMRVLLAGGILILTAYLLQYALPLNKSIWSPSFALMTCGLGATLLGILMTVIDIRNWRRWTVPFHIFGVNPLFLYVLSEVMAIIFWQFGINEWLYQGIHAIISHPQTASLVFALVHVAICGIIGYPLYRKGIYIKI